MSYRDGINRTANHDTKGIQSRLVDPNRIVLLNAVLGLSGEAGEVVDVVKKVIMHGRELDRDKLINELGDVRYYLELAAKALDVSMEEIERLNLEKLDKRYPNGFSLEHSIQKLDEK